jgi:sugar fermentation stimulation protein A
LRPFALPLLDARLLRRYARFLADVRLADGRVETVHCPNPGAMTGCATPGAAVLLSASADPRRRLRLTWELVRVGRTWVCVNTAVANRVVARWLETGRLLPGHRSVRREVPVPGGRLDFALDGRTFVEVKSVTLRTGEVAAFPDAVTRRGRRHVEALRRLRGARRVLVFFVARGDVKAVRPADEIDPAYGAALRRAVRAGVEVVAVSARFGRRGVAMGARLPVLL